MRDEGQRPQTSVIPSHHSSLARSLCFGVLPAVPGLQHHSSCKREKAQALGSEGRNSPVPEPGARRDSLCPSEDELDLLRCGSAFSLYQEDSEQRRRGSSDESQGRLLTHSAHTM